MAKQQTTQAEINQKLLEELLKIQIDAETKMLEKVAKRVKKGITTEGWNEKKLADTQALRKEIEDILADKDKITNTYINKSFIKAYDTAGANVTNQLLKNPHHILQEVNIPPHLQRMILETQNAIAGTSFQILRNVNDVYREVISETTTGVLTGVETRLQVAQQALNNFAAKGVTGFIDKAGRNWELASYVEMAIRTGNSRAALQGHVDRSLELGNDLMIVSGHAATCPLCAPWGNTIISITGKTPNYPTLAQAKESGLFHPNCKHRLSVWFEGIDEEFDEENDDHRWDNYHAAEKEKYQAIQKQRYNERMIRKYKRLESVALTPEAKIKASNKVLEWQKIQRDHVKQYDLRRKYIREGIKNRLGDATKASVKPELPKDILPKAEPQKPLETVYEFHEYTILPKNIQNNLDVLQFPAEYFNDSENLSEFEKQIIEFTAGGSDIPSITEKWIKDGFIPENYDKTAEQFLASIANAKEKKIELYRIEEAKFSFKGLKVGDNLDMGVRSFSSSKSFIDNIMADDYDVQFTDPIVYKVKSGAKSVDIKGYSSFYEQYESITAGKFKVLEIKEVDYGGKKIREVLIEQTEVPKLKILKPKAIPLEDIKITGYTNDAKGYFTMSLDNNKKITAQLFSDNQISSNSFLKDYNIKFVNASSAKDYEELVANLKSELPKLEFDDKAYKKAEGWIKEIENITGKVEAKPKVIPPPIPAKKIIPPTPTPPPIKEKMVLKDVNIIKKNTPNPKTSYDYYTAMSNTSKYQLQIGSFLDVKSYTYDDLKSYAKYDIEKLNNKFGKIKTKDDLIELQNDLKKLMDDVDGKEGWLHYITKEKYIEIDNFLLNFDEDDEIAESLVEKAKAADAKMQEKYKAYNSILGSKEDIQKQLNHQSTGKAWSEMEKKYTAKMQNWHDKLPTDQQRAVIRYTGSDYDEMNEYLRSGGKEYTGYKQQVEDCIAALDKIKIEEDMVVRRGVSTRGFAGMFDKYEEARSIGGDSWILKNKEDLIGQVCTDKGFLSTSPNKKGGFSREVNIKIALPKGTKGAYVDSISRHQGELEFLVQAGYNYMVTGIEETHYSKAEKGEKYTVFLQLILPEK